MEPSNGSHYSTCISREEKTRARVRGPSSDGFSLWGSGGILRVDLTCVRVLATDAAPRLGNLQRGSDGNGSDDGSLDGVSGNPSLGAGKADLGLGVHFWVLC